MERNFKYFGVLRRVPALIIVLGLFLQALSFQQCGYASDDLVELGSFKIKRFNTSIANASNKNKGEFGEKFVDYFYKKSFENPLIKGPISSKYEGNHGIDLYYWFSPRHRVYSGYTIIHEAKYRDAANQNDIKEQMSKAWITGTADAMEKKHPKEADLLKNSLKNGTCLSVGSIIDKNGTVTFYTTKFSTNSELKKQTIDLIKSRVADFDIYWKPKLWDQYCEKKKKKSAKRNGRRKKRTNQ